MVTGQERDPRPVLVDPGDAPVILDRGEQRLGLTEKPVGIGQRTAEDLGVPAGPQRFGQVSVVAQLAEDRYRLTELAA